MRVIIFYICKLYWILLTDMASLRGAALCTVTTVFYISVSSVNNWRNKRTEYLSFVSFYSTYWGEETNRSVNNV